MKSLLKYTLSILVGAVFAVIAFCIGSWFMGF